MKISLKKLSAAMALGGCVALSSGTAQAFSDGVAGATSQGQVGVQVTIPSLIVIDNITSDIVMNFVTGGVEANVSFCVHGTPASGTYEVALTSGVGNMNLTDGTNFLPYSASFDSDVDATIAGGGLALAYATSTASAFPFTVGLGVCGANNAAFAVQVSDLNTAGVPAGVYADTVNLTVTPN